MGGREMNEHGHWDAHFQQETGAQLVGPIILQRPQPYGCKPCTKVKVDAWLAEPEDERGPEPNIVGTMDIKAHNKWVHPVE